MTTWKLAGSTAIVLTMGTHAALADVTPEEVWQNWQDTSTAYGQTIAAESAVRDGDTLVVTGVSITMDQDGGSTKAMIDEVDFTDLGDGTVEVTMSDAYAFSMTVPATDGGAATTLSISVTAPNASTIASGTKDATNYDFSMPTLGIKLDSIEGVDAAAVNATAEANLTGVTGSYLVEADGATKKLTSDFAADTVALTIAGTDPAGPSDVKVSASMQDLAGNSSGNMLDMAAMADMASALKAGFALDAGFTFGATTYDIAVSDASGPTSVKGATASGEFGLAMDADGLSFASGSKGVSLAVSGAQIPFPEVKLTYAESAFEFSMPLSKSDAPADFSVLAKLIDFGVSDEIWGMVDPGAALPHDPATLVIDTKGTVTLTSDLTDTAAMEAMGSTPPGQLNSFELTELHAKIAGADLTGTGAFTFDNTDMTTFAGMPAPTGKVDLKITGLNGLIDKLVAMGMLPEDQAMEGRMMLSMFANPGAGEDEMTSTLEFKDRHFYANGQQLQ